MREEGGRATRRVNSAREREMRPVVSAHWGPSNWGHRWLPSGESEEDGLSGALIVNKMPLQSLLILSFFLS